MWTRDLLKMNAKQVLRNNYWMALLVAFVASLLAGGSSNIGPTLTFNYTTGSDHYNYQYGYDRAVLPYFGAVAAAAFGFVLIAMVVGEPGGQRSVLVAVLRVRRPSLPQRGESDVYEKSVYFPVEPAVCDPRHL